MSFNPFDLAEQQYKSTTQQENKPETSAMDQQVSNLSPATSSFNVAEQIYENKQPENWWEETVRDVTRIGSRAVETILGISTGRDLRDLGTSLLENAPQDVVLGRLIEETIGTDAWKKSVEAEKSGKGLYSKIPGQRQLQEFSEDITGGYTTPRSKAEEIEDEVTKTLSGLMLGGGTRSSVPGASRLQQWAEPIVNFGRKLGMSVLGESAKEGLKLYGATPGVQELGKIATLFVSGLTLPRLTGESTPDQYLSNMYRQRDALVPQGTMVSTTGLQHRLENFINNTLRYGEMTPEKRQVLNALTGENGILTNAQTGTRTMHELFQSYRDINRNRSAVMAATDLDRPGVRQARRYWGEIANIFNETIEGYLGTISPQALELNRAVNGAWSALNASNNVSNFVLNAARGIPLKTGVATLFGGGIFQPHIAAGALGGAAVAGGSVAATQLAMRFLRNPTLRHYYTQVIQNSMRENLPGTISAIKKLDESYQKELKDPKSTLNYPIGPYKLQE